MQTFILIFALFGFILFLGMLTFTIRYGRDMYGFFMAEFFPQLRTWWQTKGAAIVIHQLGLWLFFAFFFSLVWVLDAKGLLWFY